MLNKVILQGRLTTNPELKHTTSNIAVTNFSVAVEENRSDNDERKTDFFRCTAWRSTAEFICRYFEKGKPILIEGELKNNTYDDKNGNKRTDTIIIVSAVYFCGAKSNDSQAKDFEQAVSYDDIYDNIPPVE